MRLIGRIEQQAIDRFWQTRSGLPLLLLMETAAAAVSRLCLDIWGSGANTGHWENRRVLILAGQGQNGGDAFACARILSANGIPVICREIFPDQALPAEAAANRQAAIAAGLDLGPLREADWPALAAGSIIVDGIFGTGFRAERGLPPAVRAVSEKVAAARMRGALVVAIDLPSGLDADSGILAPGTIRADHTVTFVCPKVGLAAAPGRFMAGQVHVDSLNVPKIWVEDAIRELHPSSASPSCGSIDPAMIRSLAPERLPDSHKGLFGKVLLLGGSSGMPGAIALAAEAAARSGAGLLTLGVPAAIGPLLLAARPECLLNLLPDEPDIAQSPADAVIRRLLAGQTAVAAGPGSGKAAWLARALPLLIQEAERLVLDADALNLLAEQTESLFPLLKKRVQQKLPPVILTPHPGEFRRLAPDIALADRQQAARTLAGRCGCVVLLKGASTVIADPEGQVLINPTGHEGLARGGSGDVLSGLIAGLLAQGLAPAAAAACGAYLHGLAADLAAARLSRRAMLPGDVIGSLGEAFRTAGWESG